MPLQGVFIMLTDQKSLDICLNQGVYGFLMKPLGEKYDGRTKHFGALADYACLRKGSHVFLFYNRRIYYGGQCIGPESGPAFYLNGLNSPMGKAANAPLVWDSSSRGEYEQVKSRPGVFRAKVKDREGKDIIAERCMPYLIIYEDELGLKGRNILSDELYYELGKKEYPLPSNSIRGRGFCQLTPFETRISLDLIAKGMTFQSSNSDVVLSGNPMEGELKLHGMGILEDIKNRKIINENHLEAFLAGRPDLFPDKIKHGEFCICRQVPISPFKPVRMDYADICYYSSDIQLEDGSIPNVIVELKMKTPTERDYSQIRRYKDWLNLVLRNKLGDVKFYLLAQRFNRSLKLKHKDIVEHIEIPVDNHQTHLNC